MPPEPVLAFPKDIAPRGDDAAALVRALYRAKPTWRLGARGPAAFDCWSLTQLVQAHLFGRELVPVDLGASASRTDVLRAMRGHAAHAQWVEREGKPEHGDVVTMAHVDVPWHVGTYLDLDRGQIAHIAETTGFCVEGRAALAAKGYTKLTFHRFVGGC